MGKFNLAEMYYFRLINRLPLDHILLIDLYKDLADIALQKGDYDESVQLQKKLLQIQKMNTTTNNTGKLIL